MKEKTAILFPGQGIQSIGMGKQFYDACPVAKNIFDSACKVMGQDIKQVIFEGAEEDLLKTENCQPAILITTVAMYESIKKNFKIGCDFIIGHSLGEYSALCALYVLSFEECLKLVCKRAEFMKEIKGGKMAAIIASHKDVKNILSGKCFIANDNAPEQIIISGVEDDVNTTCQIAKELGKKSILLNVSGPFHSPLMISAKDKMDLEIKKYNFKKPLHGFISNSSGNVENDPDRIKALLTDQMCKGVMWRQSILKLKEMGVKKFIEISPKKMLLNLCRKIVPENDTILLDSHDSASSFFSKK